MNRRLNSSLVHLSGMGSSFLVFVMLLQSSVFLICNKVLPISTTGATHTKSLTHPSLRRVNFHLQNHRHSRGRLKVCDVPHDSAVIVHVISRTTVPFSWLFVTEANLRWHFIKVEVVVKKSNHCHCHIQSVLKWPLNIMPQAKFSFPSLLAEVPKQRFAKKIHTAKGEMGW